MLVDFPLGTHSFQQHGKSGGCGKHIAMVQSFQNRSRGLNSPPLGVGVHGKLAFMAAAAGAAEFSSGGAANSNSWPDHTWDTSKSPKSFCSSCPTCCWVILWLCFISVSFLTLLFPGIFNCSPLNSSFKLSLTCEQVNYPVKHRLNSSLNVCSFKPWLPQNRKCIF